MLKLKDLDLSNYFVHDDFSLPPPPPPLCSATNEMLKKSMRCFLWDILFGLVDRIFLGRAPLDVCMSFSFTWLKMRGVCLKTIMGLKKLLEVRATLRSLSVCNIIEHWGSFYAVIVALLCLLLKIDLKELFTWLDNRNRYWLPIWPFSATGQKMLVTTKIT